MPKKSKEGNIYDRIFRENASHFFIPLLKQQYGLQIKSFRPLEVKFPSTSENEVDFLYELLLQDGSQQILHIEFQAANDSNMLARMQEYHAKIYKKFRKPIQSLVVNLGSKTFTASNKLTEKEIFRGYEILNLFNLSTEKLLRAQVPEVILLAILSNFPKKGVEQVLRSIILKLKQLAESEKDLERYKNQLFLLSRLRKFEIVTKETLNKMLLDIDIEKDHFYLQGVERGEKEGVKKGVRKGKELGFELSIEILKLHQKGISAFDISKKLDVEMENVLAIISALED